MAQMELELVWKAPPEQRIRRSDVATFGWMPSLICRACGESKPAHHFTHDHRNTGRMGRHSYCHDCRAEQARAAYWQMKLAM